VLYASVDAEPARLPEVASGTSRRDIDDNPVLLELCAENAELLHTQETAKKCREAHDPNFVSQWPFFQ